MDGHDGMFRSSAAVSSIRVETAVKAISYLVALTGFISVAAYVSYVYSALFVVVSAIAVFLDYKQSKHASAAPYMPRWVINTVSVIVIILSVVRMYNEDIVEAAVEALLVLLSVKFLEHRRFRDYMQIYLIALFLLAGAALLSVDLSFFLYFIVFFFLISSAIVLLTYYSEAPQLCLSREVFAKIALKTMAVPLFSIPLAAFIFLVLPRTDYPFFSFLNRSGVGRSGFADSVTLGGVSSIQEDKSIIFRANMEKIDDADLYWRGILFDVFDGTSWKSSQAEGHTDNAGLPRGRRIAQSIYLEPYGNKYLFALDKPVSIFLKNSHSTDGFIYVAKKEIKTKLRYDAVSVIENGARQAAAKTPDKPPDMDKYLKLPESLPPEIAALAVRLSRGKTGRSAIEAILTYLRDGGYSYSLTNLPKSETPLSEFLFKTKSGNCEYFASSMAVMLRASGIAANVLGGYKGGQYNTIGGYYMVSQKDAHVWVEAYIEGEGWRRFDPTPGNSFSFNMEKKGGLIRSFKITFDTLNYYWGVFVINYNLDRQLTILQKLRTNIRMPVLKGSAAALAARLKKWGWAMAAALAVMLSAAAIRWIFFNKTPKETRLLRDFLGKLRKFGFVKRPSDGLDEFVSSISDDGLRAQAGEFAVEFEKIYYRDERFTKERLKRLRAMLKAMRPP
ncbi:MAG: DUF3488 and transglutaminase-like domain-containing protein [Candidatus Magnetominusculus sp. LBB02]|nr:DUF3488 and transglutaminase-like domain-containing protein [Candidatus Magnetominusculus sp. LBB02]